MREQSVRQSVRQSIAFLLAFHLRQQTETEAAPAVLAKLYGRIVVELSLSSLAGKGQELAKRCNIAFHYAHNFNYANRTAEQEFTTEIPELHFPHIVEITKKKKNNINKKENKQKRRKLWDN